MFHLSTHGPVTRVQLAATVLGRPLVGVSAYRLGPLLIDTGLPWTRRRLVAWAQDTGVERVVLTHHHEDHVGAAAQLSALGLPVAAPALALERLARGPRVPLYRHLVWGRPAPFRAEPLGERVDVFDYSFRVIPTPGHAFDHVCLYDDDRGWLFGGDLYVHERVKFLRRVEDLALHLDSLRRIAALEPKLLFCAHAGVIPDAAAALRRKIAFWENLAGRAQDLAANGWSLRPITRELLGREGLFTWLSRGDFAKVNLVRALLLVPGAPGR
ncbi:MAG: MBL fold metallo-hydrolase [Thermoanaerobaculia bacterium]|nr:MBL fold metallo-hydrolase [Thermoanaerobaculia bacterium]